MHSTLELDGCNVLSVFAWAGGRAKAGSALPGRAAHRMSRSRSGRGGATGGHGGVCMHRARHCSRCASVRQMHRLRDLAATLRHLVRLNTALPPARRGVHKARGPTWPSVPRTRACRCHWLPFVVELCSTCLGHQVLSNNREAARVSATAGHARYASLAARVVPYTRLLLGHSLLAGLGYVEPHEREMTRGACPWRAACRIRACPGRGRAAATALVRPVACSPIRSRPTDKLKRQPRWKCGLEVRG